MTTCPPSNSEPGRDSSSFELLSPGVRRWVWDQGWDRLRPAQEQAIPAVLAGTRDVIVSAATAAGKTEAVFLPICSAIDRSATTGQPQGDTGRPRALAGGGVQVLYLAPLKALINDQHRRLSQMCQHLDVPVHRWHGDVPASKKAALRTNPDGILLITPESLEALFVRRGTGVPAMFAGLRYVVVDELHSFLGTERGAQLTSLLHRVELAVRRRVPRIGLSATLGDMTLAAEALRPGAPGQVRVIVDPGGGQQLSVQVRGYLADPRGSAAPAPASPAVTAGFGPAAPTSPEATASAAGASAGAEVDGQDAAGAVTERIVTDLFRVLRGHDNLVFANSRAAVETYAARLREHSEALRVPNEFFPHHGSLGREVRESVEAALKDPARPTTAVATTTLEMGIDIGNVHSIAQVGPPPSVASLRQRLGRSGRRGEPAILRAYLTEEALDTNARLTDELRLGLVQTVAMLELLLENWCEPPEPGALHLSTLTQQLLSLIAQHGGVTPADAHIALCGPGSPFTGVAPAMFGQLLRDLASHDVITQGSDRLLLLDKVGEAVVEHYSFYTAFTTGEEYRLFVAGRPLGTVPIDYPLTDGMLLVFAGRRWRVLSVDQLRKTVDLAPASGGKPPRFASDGPAVHQHVRERMRAVLAGTDNPRYLSATAVNLLAEARAAYRRYRLDEVMLLARSDDPTTPTQTLLLPWAGSTATSTLALQLRAAGLDASAYDTFAVTVERTAPEHVTETLAALDAAGPADPVELAGTVNNKVSAKYDHWLSEPLLCQDYARRALDTAGAWHAAHAVLASTGTPSAPTQR